MENTSCGKECAFVKSGFCNSEKECPNFVQSIWQKDGEPAPKLVSDCFPKKFALEQNHLLHRVLCTQSVLEELRHKVSGLENVVTKLCEILSMKSKENKQCNIDFDDKENFKSLE